MVAKARGATSAGRQVIRMFVDDPLMRWRAFPVSRGMSIYRGEARVQKFAGNTMRIATAVVEFDGDKPVALTSLSISNWKIGADGFADQNEQMRGIVEKIDGGAGDADVSMATKEDVEAIKRCLGLGGAS